MGNTPSPTSDKPAPPVWVQPSLFPEPPLCRVLDGVLLVLEGVALALTTSEIAPWLPLVLAELSRRGLHPDTETKYSTTAVHLVDWLDAHGITAWDQITSQLIGDFCEVPNPRGLGQAKRLEPGTVRGRHTAAFAVLSVAQSLGAPVDPRELSTTRPPPGPRAVAARPLTDEEAEWLERFSRSGLHPRPIAMLVSLAFSGGTNDDLAAVRKSDLDLEAGTVKFAGAFERVNKMRERDAETIGRYLEHDTDLGDDSLLCMTGRANSPKGARSVGERLHLALRGAGLSHTPGVSVRSIRLTGAKRVFEESGIAAAARYMGSPSLDAAAAALRHDWRRSDA